MTFLPIVERELRVAARLTATYRNRALAAGLVAVTAGAILWIRPGAFLPIQIGTMMFGAMSYITLLFCLAEGARKTADCLSEEKRDGTLGLLFLTDLKGYDVVLGKLAANSLSSIYGLLAILPVLGLPLLVGGVTPGEYWRVALALVSILFFSLCAGMFVSSFSRVEQRAAGGTAMLVVGFAVFSGLKLVQPVWPLSPVHAFLTAFDRRYAAESGGYWASLALAQVWSWLLLAGACLIVPHSWQEKTSRTPRATATRIRHAERRSRLRTQMLEINPVFWLAGREQGQQTALYGFAGITLAAAILIFFSGLPVLPGLLACGWFLNLAVKMRVAAQAARCLAEARQNNSLEMILTTPLTMDQIIKGQLQALESKFRTPVVCIIATEFVACAVAAVAAEGKKSSGEGTGMVILLLLAYLAVFALDLAAVAWAGMWFGLTSKKETQAATKTILWVLVAPSLSLLYWCPGLLVYLGWPIFWIQWAPQKVREEFVRLAARRYALNPVATGWVTGVSAGSANAPPVLTGKLDEGDST